MPREGLDLTEAGGATGAQIFDMAYGTFAPQPDLEDVGLSARERSNYRAIGVFLILLAAACGTVAAVSFRTTGAPPATSVALALILVAGLLCFGVALLTLRKLLFVVGLLSLAVMLLAVTVAFAVDLITGGGTFGVLLAESGYATPVGELVFTGSFGGGSLYMAIRIGRSRQHFYGLE